MKRIIFLVILLIVLLGGGVCGSLANKLFKTILEGNSQSFSEDYSHAKYCFGSNAIFKLLPTLLHGKYLVLLQNNYELRPTGGFMGSYALLTFDNGVLKNWEIQDIYTPDGQIEGHVPPLVPFQQAFKTGDWRLPNSNWNPNFQEATADILWFFDKGGVKDVRGVIAVNFELFRQTIALVGPFKPYDIREEITADNFYTLTQGAAEDNFFPGSRAKKNYLSGIGTTLFDLVPDLSLSKKIQLAKLVVKQLNTGQILLWNQDSTVQKFIIEKGWAGVLKDFAFDYFYLVEANLGVNKANCCITREILQDIATAEVTTNKTTVTFMNNSDQNLNKWSGDYYNYQRIIIPKNAQIKSLQVGGINYQETEKKDPYNPPDRNSDISYTETVEGNYKIIAFWVIVPALQARAVELEYQLPQTKMYATIVQRQPGVYNLPYKLVVNGIGKKDLDLGNEN